MAPKGGAGNAARTSCMTARPRRRRKKKEAPLRCDESFRPASDTVVVSVSPDEVSCVKEEEDGGVCSTPKGERYKIPAMGTCPPAPKKRRRPGFWSRGRRSFFASPEIEAFFLHALGGISV
ncbi:hypothetical protein MLD38_017160 [Melastoma candidum]|uniref:Uncharacterized protein n=1 Tax=Melastoma candidum TaxID=119954 RepID=A0ACB9QPT6_9MYRT|nr:hypothetical protein MLD38_017160 [Melastoma candidum]